MENRGAGITAQHGVGHHGRRDRTTDGLGLLVNQKDAVGVTVKGETNVGPNFQNTSLEVHEVLGLNGVGRVVREGAVQFGVHDLEVKGQTGEDLGGHEATHAVSRVGHDLERTQLGGVNKGVDVLDPGRNQVQLVGLGQGARRRRSQELIGQRFDFLQTGVGPDGLGPL